MYMASEGICHRAYYTVTDIWQAGYGRSASKTLATIGEGIFLVRIKSEALRVRHSIQCFSASTKHHEVQTVSGVHLVPVQVTEHWTRSDIHRDFFKSAAFVLRHLVTEHILF